MWFLGPTRVHIPSGISIGSVAFAGHTIVTNSQTNRFTHTERRRYMRNNAHLYTPCVRCGLIKKENEKAKNRNKRILRVCVIVGLQQLGVPGESFQNAARELLEWCSDVRAFQPHFEQRLLGCLLVSCSGCCMPHLGHFSRRYRIAPLLLKKYNNCHCPYLRLTRFSYYQIKFIKA